MEDRFRCRAWDLIKKEYIYNAELTYDNKCGGFGSMNHASFGELLYDENYIIEQCTGIKDKNGKLIYEGDLFKVFDDIISAKVIWNNKTASYKVKMLFNSDEWHGNYGGYYEDEISDLSDWLDEPIIGNIHENPELMEI